MKPQLLCTFAYFDRLSNSIGDIYNAYDDNTVYNMKCYCYIETPNNVVAIYNISSGERRLKDTISINRKKETNTFYSINALNGLIRVLNNGVLDKQFMIDWRNFTDTLLLSDDQNGYRAIKVKELSI
jgi:hypothetical protein